MEKCDFCSKKPIANYQKVWVRWVMTPDGDYASKPDYNGASELNDMDEPTDGNNIHVCKKHEEKLLNGDLDFGGF